MHGGRFKKRLRYWSKSASGDSFCLNSLTGYPRGNHITFDELVAGDDIKRCILTTFDLDTEWVVEKFAFRCPLVLVAHPRKSGAGVRCTQLVENQVMLIEAPVPDLGKFHIKLVTSQSK